MSMVAPHFLRSPLVLHLKDRPGLFKLVATDSTGGVLTAYGGAETPGKGELLSFHPVDDEYGAVRLMARSLQPVAFPGSVTLHVAVQWVAVTASESASHLASMLGVMGVKVHIPENATAHLDEHHELVYEPHHQRVRMIQVRDGFIRQPTGDIAQGISEQARSQPGILVETVLQDEILRWHAHQTGSNAVVTQNRLGPPPEPPPKTSQDRGTTTDRILSRSIVRAKADRSVLDPAWRPDALWNDGRERGGTGRYRMAPEGSSRVERIDAVASTRRPAPVMAPPSLPEFDRQPNDGEVSIGKASHPMVCVALGQRSCSFEVVLDNIPVGAIVRVGVPADPFDEGLLWVSGSLEGYVDAQVVDNGVRIQVRLESKVPRDYRRLVQHWSRWRKGR